MGKKFAITIERRIIRTVLLDVDTRTQVNEHLDTYGVAESFQDLPEIENMGSDSFRVLSIKQQR